MRTTSALGVVAVILAGCAADASVPTDPTTQLIALVEEWRVRTPAPGVVVSVTGESIGEQFIASGTLHRGGAEPMVASTRFRVASVTKILVATVVLQLEEEGRLSFDDPVDEVSSPTDAEVARMLEGVTVRHLLAHTSGLPDSGRSPDLIESLQSEPERVWTLDEVMALVAGSEREFSPGASFGYSNTNYHLLGRVIETVTGRSWWEETRARMLDPLGMEDSHLAGFEEPTGPLSPGYFDADGDGFTEEVPDPWPALGTSEGPSGALVSTAGDLQRFAAGLFGEELVSGSSLQEMTTAGAFASRYTGYGLGVEVLRPDLETLVWGHGGFLPGYRTILWHAPDEDVTVVVLTNESRSRPDGLAELVLRTVTDQPSPAYHDATGM